MHVRFDPYFSITVVHPFYPSAKKKPGVAVDFQIVPWGATTKFLKNNGLVFKSRAGGCDVFLEKTVLASGQLDRRFRRPGVSVFKFWLLLDEPALLNQTIPYTQNGQPNAGLPKLGALTRLLYFDNLNAQKQADTQNSLAVAEQVGVDDVGFFGGKFFKINTSETSSLKTESLQPGKDAVTVFHPKPGLNFIQAELPEDAYRVTLSSAQTRVAITSETESPPPNALGYIQIIKNGSGPEGAPMEYKITFLSGK